MAYSLQDLLYLMGRLRDPITGCPWDLKQRFDTIVPHSLEEVYELVDAIEANDLNQVRQELGDVLFQVVFYSRLGEEQGLFNFDDVVDGITTKLLRRHPHVFPDGSLQSIRDTEAPKDDAIKQRWEDIKQAERSEKSQGSVMDDIPQALPALTRAAKLQKRARNIGFDWADIDEVIAAFHDEIRELEDARADGDANAIADEMGDVLFSAVNVCRHLGLDPEAVTRAAGKKFERRFRFVEQRCQESAIDNSTGQASAQLELFWDQAKAAGL
jgi:ATP diphosphatase